MGTESSANPWLSLISNWITAEKVYPLWQKQSVLSRAFICFVSAATHNKQSLVLKLLDLGVDINIENKLHCTALLAAVQEGHLDMVRLLFEKGAKFELLHQHPLAESVIHAAARLGHLDILKFADEQGTYLMDKDSHGHTPLFYAASSGSLPVFLLENGADINAANQDEDTALHEAARCGHLSVVRYLIGKGADAQAKNAHGRTPLDVSAGGRHLDIVEYLLEKGADLNVSTSRSKQTVLHVASVNGHSNIVKCLIENGFNNLNAVDDNGDTALHNAALKGHLDIVQYLLEKGAFPHAKNYNAKTPQDVSNNDETTKYIAEYKGSSEAN
ncbi:hypothetical protein GYMLUDRAFT_1022735 [Collybiopsis luxurians FD-317 M1]|uniref:Uncharacterized protein n=1 Tax=Collybiopsis luxurians FD-317 M1 TaxID=944289 RepID=A0A0D0BHV9_9AGAR|nr:hypothetical protein GYMLUDRAFT_1022735 [Collybiopsis luxurians FD-317 M1]